MLVKKLLRELFCIITDDELCEYIISRINKDHKEKIGYIDIKSKLRKEYEDMEKEKIEEEYEKYNLNKIALESMNVENIAIACISALAVLISVLSLVYSLKNNMNNVVYNIIIIFVVVVLFCLFYVVMVGYRIKKKAKDMAYYSIVIEVLEEIRAQKKMNDKKYE
ncbi:hypothetical protein PQV03_10585 [Thermoanaerobacterium thermosaccharolyticum]|uniref:hypothetical protein n=1 Tax=Thermoanaerobacterium thermosaccharolyticum TaxID=1517 RepID=UPI003D2B8F32